MGGVAFAIIVGFVAFGIAFGIAQGITRSALRRYLNGRNEAFKNGLLSGRRWLAEYIAESEYNIDRRDTYLQTKKHAAMKSGEIVKEIKREKRNITRQLMFYKYIVKSYEEYFPFLSDYRNAILDETIPLSSGVDNVDTLKQSDPVVQYLSSEEFRKIPVAKRNQLALDRYMQRPKANWEIGKMYERYIGYLYEKDGWDVHFHGAVKGFEDLGRDLICKRGDNVIIIQAKCWSSKKVIREKHVFQLYGSALLYKMENSCADIHPMLCVTTDLSNVALYAAKELGIEVNSIPFDNDYPMVKCNVSKTTGEKIYHLPFDQQYDRIKIFGPDECYVGSVAKAEKLGFRRAWRFTGATSPGN